LLARIKTVLRRTTMLPPVGSAARLQVGGLTIDLASSEVRRSGAPLALAPAEYRLLWHLVRNRGRLLTHDWLVERVWGRDACASPSRLKSLVSRLRVKLGRDGRPASIIRNERGLGYRFVPPASAPSAAEEPGDDGAGLSRPLQADRDASPRGADGA
jgi:two-component system KDP operon response regulator KdpE